jgi:hypothetical protein
MRTLAVSLLSMNFYAVLFTLHVAIGAMSEYVCSVYTIYVVVNAEL